MESEADTAANDYASAARALRSLSRELKTGEVREELRALASAYERLALHVTKMALQPMRAEDMRGGESYDSWICQACGTPIALAPRSPDASPFDMPDGVIRLRCPHCHAQRFYAIHDRRVRPYPFQ